MGGKAKVGDEMKYAIYVLIILCGVLPLVFRKNMVVRIVSLIILGASFVFYLMGLQTSARLAAIDEFEMTKKTPSTEWIDGTIKTRGVIETLHPMGILIFLALIVLAVKRDDDN